MKSFFRLILATVFAMVATIANAENYTLVVGETVLKNFEPANCTYVAETDCFVLIETQEVFVVKCDDKEVAYQYVGLGLPYAYEVTDVKAGSVITVTSDFVWSSGSIIRLSVFSGGGAIPVEAKSITPAAGEVFKWNTAGMISVNFSKAVSLSTIKLVAGEKEYGVSDVHVGTSLGFSVAEALNSALADGAVAPGEPFSVRISGLRDAMDDTNLYGGDGVLTIDYIAPYPQHRFVSATVGGKQISYTAANEYKFLSYYPVDGEDGVFVFEFDAEVGKVSNLTLQIGNLDLDSEGMYYRGDVPYTIDGNKVIADLRGTLRSIAVLFPMLGASGEGAQSEMYGGFDINNLYMTMGLMGVQDTNGNAFLSDNAGSIGSYYFVMKYEQIEDNVSMDGDNKQDGDEVRSGENVRLWLSNAGLKINTIEVAYVAFGGVDDLGDTIRVQHTINIADYKIEDDPYGMIISFDMPNIDEAIAGSRVRIVLPDSQTSDGMPHFLYIDFVAASLANGISNVAAQKADDTIYTINGVKAANTNVKGLYIVNGKKYLKL